MGESPTVFVNGRSVIGKHPAGMGVAFPDICLTPAGPSLVPVPYPNVVQAKDLKDGTKQVKVMGGPAMTKASHIARSTGNEAGTGGGVVTGGKKGKAYVLTTSLNVRFEGELVVRHLDLLTHNHTGQMPGNTPPAPIIGAMAAAGADGSTSGDCCQGQAQKAERECQCSEVIDEPYVNKKGETKTRKKRINCTEECRKAQKCTLVTKKNDKTACCGDCNTGHHLIEAAALHDVGRGHGAWRKAADGTKIKVPSIPVQGVSSTYNERQAPCVCVDGVGHTTGNHGIMHTFQSYAAIRCPLGRVSLQNGTIFPPLNQPEIHVTTYGEAKRKAAEALIATFPDSGCKTECIVKQLDDYHQKQGGISDETKIKAVHTRNVTEEDLATARDAVDERIQEASARRTTDSDF